MHEKPPILYSDCPPNFRWRQVVELYERGESTSLRFDDEWVCRGLAFLTRLRACRSDEGRQALNAEFPDISAAYQLHNERDRITHAIPQARLLAGLSVDEIAAAQKLPPAAIIAYEKLFFSVLGRLKQSVYIIGTAIDRRIFSHELTLDDGDVFLKWFAYSYGPATIEPTLDYLQNGLVIPKNLDQAPLEELERLVSRLKTHALIVLCVLPGQKSSKSGRIMEMADEVEELIEARSKPASNAGMAC